MNGRFFGACFFIFFGTKRSCCSIDDYSSILQQPRLIEHKRKPAYLAAVLEPEKMEPRNLERAL